MFTEISRVCVHWGVFVCWDLRAVSLGSQGVFVCWDLRAVTLGSQGVFVLWGLRGVLCDLQAAPSPRIVFPVL